jgi:exosortase/archaeosortase family protein
LNNPDYTFIILTFNEELNLPKLLSSIKGLNAKTYVLDSGSTDRTMQICEENDVEVSIHKFVNHPEQWDYALKVLKIVTPWIIGLDADHTLSTELYAHLKSFKNEDYLDIDGIYFNRKYIFKGQWIRYGGYYRMYLLKMFRRNVGFSDLTEQMDHRFIVRSKTAIWKEPYLIEENLKENEIGFWINKHNKYSDLLAAEYINEHRSITPWTNRATPNDRKILNKKIWNTLPLYFRGLLYFLFRYVIQLGFLDGKTGMLFHFLHSFWFRTLVDIKIGEHQARLRKEDILSVPNITQAQFLDFNRNTCTFENNKQRFTIKTTLSFILSFAFLSTFFYIFHVAFIGLTTPGGYYLAYLDQHLNYIDVWRYSYLQSSALILEVLGHKVTHNQTTLLIENNGGFKLVYSCLGYGIFSIFTAFVISFQLPSHKITVISRCKFLLFGFIVIQAANTLRLIAIALFWTRTPLLLQINHHEIFNAVIYIITILMIICWIKTIERNAKKPVKEEV